MSELTVDREVHDSKFAAQTYGYRAGDALFATESAVLIGEDGSKRVAGPSIDELISRLPAVFDNADVSTVFGSLPYDLSAGCELVVPASARHYDRRCVPGEPMPLNSGEPLRTEAIPSRERHAELVEHAVRRIRDGKIQKVVLARLLQFEYANDVSIAAVVGNLLRANQSGFVFAMPTANNETFLGASPELLLSRRGVSVSSHPLAGSAPRLSDPALDRAQAQALLTSRKDLAEHAFVVDAVAQALRPYCSTLQVPTSPSVVGTPQMWHLGTKISGILADRDATALHLAAALHPTPAVGGTPDAPALALQQELEPFDRDLYAGMTGWTDHNGDGEWAVSIRCASIDGSTVRAHAGGGIVAQSQPCVEVDETSSKFRTLLRAMGLDQQL